LDSNRWEIETVRLPQLTIVLEKLQEAAGFTSDDIFVYTIGELIADLDAAQAML
jgi:hypothetical protein